jgi:hypothetical protein
VTDGSYATLGAICHVIAHSKEGPRGETPLNTKERNSYRNLILMCSHHHDIVDEDSKKYTEKLLLEIKKKHEEWVDEKLAFNPAKKLNKADLYYSEMIDYIVAELKLERWDYFINNAVNERINFDFIYAKDSLNAKLLGAIWPGKRKDLEKCIREVLNSYDSFISHFETNGESNGDYLVTDRSYRRYWNPKYHEYLKRENRWAIKGYFLLCDYVIKINLFSNLVRKNINPRFFASYGKFLMIDQFGHFHGGTGRIFIPTAKYVQENLKLLSKNPGASDL